MQVSSVKADCLSCGFWHYRPYLGDFSYGSFIAEGSTGEVYAYLHGLNNAAWDRLTVLADVLSSDMSFFHWLVGRCLDPISGVSLSITNRAPCPKCGSSNMELGSLPAGRVDIPEATFSGFLSLDPLGQETRVAELHRVWSDEHQNE